VSNEDFNEAVEVAADEITEYTSESEAVEVDEAAPQAPIVIDRPVQTVGRRKEAIVRVRLTPGTGEFKLNGRTLEDYKFGNANIEKSIKLT